MMMRIPIGEDKVECLVASSRELEVEILNLRLISSNSSKET
jgi:hypothetical protein